MGKTGLITGGVEMLPLVDLKREYYSVKEEIDGAVAKVLQSGWYILGKNLEAFENEFAGYIGTNFAIGVGNGLEALQLALLAYDVREGDEVITVPNSAVATALAISATGAKPVFVDVDPETYNIEVAKIEQKLTAKTKAILPVHLFGQTVDMDPLIDIASHNDLIIIEDACQAHGAEYRGKRVGSLGNAGCFSFYPTKNLGAFGDGGMVVTNDVRIAKRVALLRNYGQKIRYVHSVKGLNSRLDEMQAAILRVKLRHLDEWNKKRRRNAKLYNELLKEADVVCPVEKEYARHVYHLYVIRSRRRDRLQAFLSSNGIETLIHYPTLIHLQEAYKHLGMKQGMFPVAEKVASEILSLPIFPQLKEEELERIANLMKNFAGACP